MGVELFIGRVPGEFEELVWVGLTMIFSLGLLVAFGAWWSR